MNTVTITIETLQAGQPRAYADSFYEYSITVRGENIDSNHRAWAAYGWNWTEAKIKKFVHEFLHAFYEKVDAPHAFAPILESCEITDENDAVDQQYVTWRVLIRELYAD